MSTPPATFVPSAALRHAPVQALVVGVLMCLLSLLIAVVADTSIPHLLGTLRYAMMFGLAYLLLKARAQLQMTLTEDGVHHKDWRRSGFIAYEDVTEFVVSRWRGLQLRTSDGRTLTLWRGLEGRAEFVRRLFDRVRAANPNVSYNERALAAQYLHFLSADHFARRHKLFFGRYAFAALFLGTVIVGIAHWPIVSTFAAATCAALFCQVALVQPHLKSQIDFDSERRPTVSSEVEHRQTLIVWLVAVPTLLASWWVWLPTA